MLEIQKLINPNLPIATNASVVMRIMANDKEYKKVPFAAFLNAVNKALKLKNKTKEPVKVEEPEDKVEHKLYEVTRIPSKAIQGEYVLTTFINFKDFTDFIKNKSVDLFFDEVKIFFYTKKICYAYFFTDTDNIYEKLKEAKFDMQ